jgi:outer membrane lipoprotein carrier protein
VHTKRQQGTILTAVAFAALAVGASLAGETATPAAEPAASTASALGGLQAWLDGTRDLEGSFQQSLVSGALGSGLEERGRVYVERPGRMRWDYRDPERKVAIVDGDRTWLYVEDEAQLYLGRLDENGALLPALMAADRRLTDWFDAELLAPATSGEESGIRLRLTPRGDAESFQSVVVTLRPPQYAIESAEVLDPAGNRMLYRFSKLRRNKGLEKGLFDFEAPEGTAVVGAH